MWMPAKSWMPLKKIKTHSSFFGMQKGWLMASLMQRLRKNFGRDGEPCPSLRRQNSGCNLLDMKCCFLVCTRAILSGIPESCFKNLKKHREVIDRSPAVSEDSFHPLSQCFVDGLRAAIQWHTCWLRDEILFSETHCT